MTTSRELLDLIAAFVAESGGAADGDRLQAIAQKFDVALGDAILDRASMQNEA